MATTGNFRQLTDLTEEGARELFENLRWPTGAVCPCCGADKPYKLTPRADSTRPVRAGVYKCRGCRKQFTVTVGTVMSCTLSGEHRAIDGATGAELLAEFRRLIEHPWLLMV